MPDFAVKTAFTAVDRMSPAFNRMSKNADGFGARMSKSMSAVSSAMMGMLPFFGVAMIGNYAAKAIELASSLTEVQNVVDTTFGANANQINDWASSAIEKFGLSELQAKKFTGSLGAMMKSSGLTGDAVTNMSTKLVGLAGDFASFYNLDAEEAFNKIRSGISGETEPLKQLGINMSVANLEAFALTQGIRKQWTAMSQAEQVQLRYNYLLKASSDANGDFAKTLDTSYANQKRVLGVQFDQALARLATGILPSLTGAFKSMNEAMKNIDWKAVGDTLATILSLIPYVVAGFVAWKVATYAVAAAQLFMAGVGWIKYLHMMLPLIFSVTGTTSLWTLAQWGLNAAMTANPIGALIVGIGALIAAGVLLYKNWDTVKVFFIDFWTKWQGLIKLALIPLWPFIQAAQLVIENWTPVSSFFSWLWEGIKAGAEAVLPIIQKVVDISMLPANLLSKGISLAESGAEYLTSPNQTEVDAKNSTANYITVNSNGTEANVKTTPKGAAKINMNQPLGANL